MARPLLGFFSSAEIYHPFSRGIKSYNKERERGRKRERMKECVSMSNTSGLYKCDWMLHLADL